MVGHSGVRPGITAGGRHFESGWVGSIATKVELLSEMRAADEAMLLYDMEVEELGSMRVAEHFTLNDGRIARIRQIHDTAALRAAGFAQ